MSGGSLSRLKRIAFMYIVLRLLNNVYNVFNNEERYDQAFKKVYGVVILSSTMIKTLI